MSKRGKLETQLRNLLLLLDHKRAVAARHAPGTAWRTRAEREIAATGSRIAVVRARLNMLTDA